jgi:WbqC-like protein
MNCVILQPSYIPWRGYFHQIQRADVFVFYDDVQYDKHGWRNRNRIKTAAGLHWLTVPVFTRGVIAAGTPINEVRIRWDPDWSAKHAATVRHAYGRAPHFQRYVGLLEEAFAARPERLIDLTIPLTIRLAAELGLGSRRFLRSSELGVRGPQTERLVGIAREVGADHYVTGPAARDYLDEKQFLAAGISVEYMRYEYPPYPQEYPPFEPLVSILDLLFMTGEAAPEFIWGASAAGR